MFYLFVLFTSVPRDVSKVVGTIATLVKSGGDMSHPQIRAMDVFNFSGPASF